MDEVWGEYWEEEWEEIGNKIIEAVGLPLIKGTPLEFGHSVWIFNKEGAMSPDEMRFEIQDQLKKLDALMYHRAQLERLLIIFDFFNKSYPSRSSMINIFKEIDEVFAAPDLSKSISQRTNEIYNQYYSRKRNVYLFISNLYREYFGKEPVYTYSELEGYPGKFWDFVRALRNIAGIKTSESAIRQDHYRYKKEKKFS